MPIIKSAKKQAQLNLRNRAHNLKYQNAIKKAINAYYLEKDAKKKEKKLAKAFSAVDKAVKINLIQKNKAARIKSKLIRQSEKKIITKKRIKKIKKTRKSK